MRGNLVATLLLLSFVNAAAADKVSEFRQAISSNDSEALQRIAQKDPKVLEWRSAIDEPVITWALRRRSFRVSAKTIDTLADLGCSLEIRDCTGARPIHVAIAADDAEAISIIMRHGSPLDIHVVAALGMRTELRRLLDRDREAIRSVTDGMTPLMMACRHDQPACITILLDRGADPNVIINEDNALRCAIRSGSVSAVDLMLSGGAKVGGEGFGEESLMLTAVESGSLEITKRLIAAGAPPSAALQDGSTPLIVAAHGGNTAIIRELLRFSSGRPELNKAVLGAAFNGRCEALSVLIEAGGDVNAVGFRGTSALGAAASHGRWKAARLLIELGADVHHVDDDGFTVTDLATRKKDALMQKVLADATAR